MISPNRPAVPAGLLLLVLLAGGPLAVGQQAGSPASPPAANQSTAHPAPSSPLAADESLRHFELHPALRIELAACEPAVVDPVSIRFDEAGRMWVVEMRDYPHGPPEGQPPLSRIKTLEDRDGDGRFETAHVFADQLLFATGLQPWRGGVIVTLAGEVAYLKDTDGDGRADLREIWFSGFAEENPQLRANHPTFALDNHVYVANGLRGGDVIARKADWAENARPVSISGMDFRFDPLTGKCEAVSGVGQFGLTFDDYGNRFVCSNRNPCKHIVLEDRYLKRNAHLAVSAVAHDVSPAAEASRVYAISRTWTTSTLHAGQFTAACGVTIYRGDFLPLEFRGNSFTCEPTGNLVHRDVLEPQGATFTSRPGREGVEFLASRDEWFRPVNLANGPDGALYVVDMYRAVIEHPQFMPDELKTRPDLRLGDDRGRIYRIVPREMPGRGARRAELALGGLSKLDERHLVEFLDHENAWHAETASRLIHESQNPLVAAELVARASQAARITGRIRALWALAGLNRLQAETLYDALLDASPRVHEQAVLLAESIEESDDTLRRAFRNVLETRDDRLAFQVVLSGGFGVFNDLDGPEVTDFTRLAVKRTDDAWMRTAFGLALNDRSRVLYSTLLLQAISEVEQTPGVTAALAELVRTATAVVGARGKDRELATVLFELTAQWNELDQPVRQDGFVPQTRVLLAALDGLADGLARSRSTLAKAVGALSPHEQRAIEGLLAEAVRLAGIRELESEVRREALRLLRHAAADEAVPVLKLLARAEGDQLLRLAAVETLARFGGADLAAFLLEDFSIRTPADRRALLDAVLADADGIRYMLSEIEADRFDARELDQTRVQRLLKHRVQDIRDKAHKLLAAAPPPDRQQVLDEYQAAVFGDGKLYESADAGRGRAVFEKQCATCHRIGTLGVNVAPDIADSRTKQPAQLLLDILDPNRAIDNNYFSYTVLDTDGRMHSGIVSTETANSVTLQQPEGKTVTVLRSQIEEFRNTGVSLMPVGLEKAIPPGKMADLISFIKNWRYLDGQVPLK